MLRLVIVLLLLAANGLMLAWQQGWLGAAAPSQQDREPERLKRQVNPEQLRALPPLAASAALAEAARASASAASGPVDSAASAASGATAGTAPGAMPGAASGAPSGPAAGAAPAAGATTATVPASAPRPAPVATPAASAAAPPKAVATPTSAPSMPLQAPKANAPAASSGTPAAPASGARRTAATPVTLPASTVAMVSVACLEVGPFALAELPAAEKAMQAAALPAGSWTVVKSERSGSFMIYMGRYADQAALERKQAQLQRLKVDSQPMSNWPDLEPGLVLGRFEDKAAADAEMARLTSRGVRTSRLITVTPSVTLASLRVPAADATLRSQLNAVKLPLPGMAFGPCSGDTRKA